MAVLGFDVFGTLVDPASIAERVRPFADERTDALVGEWRRSQLEYVFRRAAMGRYRPFDRVTRAALDHALTIIGIDVPETERERLVAAWNALPAFVDAAPALQTLRTCGHRCFAFSNGTTAGLQTLMAGTGLDAHLDGVISVEAVGTYKPAPAVYDYLVECGGVDRTQTWLVSGNAWDVIGARSAGLSAAWLQRDPVKPFDPWDEAPDLVVESLTALADELAIRSD